MHTAVNLVLDHFYLARSRGDTRTQLVIAIKLVDVVIPELMTRLTELHDAIERRDRSVDAQSAEELTRG